MNRELRRRVAAFLARPPEEAGRELPPEITYRARLLHTLGLLISGAACLIAAAQLFFWIHPGFPPAPWDDLVFDAMGLLAGLSTLWFVQSGRLRPAAWTVIGLFLGFSALSLFINGRPLTDVSGRSSLLLTNALAFVLLERRRAWSVLAASVVIFVSMHVLWWGGYLPDPVSRHPFGQLTFSIVVWTMTATILSILFRSATRTLREWARNLRQRVQELTLLHETGRTITRLLDVDELLNTAVQSLHRRFGYHSVTIVSLDERKGVLRSRAIAGRWAEVMAPDQTLELNQGLIGWTARHAETVLVNDVTTDTRYVNRYPESVHTRSELCVPVRIGDSVLGVLDVQSEQPDAFDESDARVLETLAGQLAGAMENARLYEAERAAHRQVRDLVTHLQNDRERERTHIAREILDEFGQLMTALHLDLSWLTGRLPEDHAAFKERLDGMSTVIDESLQVVRRLSSQLRPSVLDHFGLVPAIRAQADAFSERSCIPYRLHVDEGTGALDPELSTGLFRILQESLINVEEHAEATEVRIDLDIDPDRATLTVADDGRGITAEEISAPHSLGLAGMRQRAHALGGQVTIEALSGSGTKVTASVPRIRPASHT